MTQADRAAGKKRTSDIVFSKTNIGQAVYDFGFSTVTEKHLARKYGRTLADVRELRRRIRLTLDAPKGRDK